MTRHNDTPASKSLNRKENGKTPSPVLGESKQDSSAQNDFELHDSSLTRSTMSAPEEDNPNRNPNEGDDEDDDLPIDRGWAWVILAGAFLNVMILVGYGRSVGILFVEYLRLFDASAAATTLFMGIMAATFSISSLFSMNVVFQILGARKTVLLGGAISTIGMGTAVFATSITYLVCTHSILIGIGHSMIHGPALVLISKYFKKRRGLATSIAMSGLSFGSSTFPLLIQFLVEKYTVKGAMLILTGITMNMMVGGMLFRPLESHQRKRKGKKSISEDQTLTRYEPVAQEEDIDVVWVKDIHRFERSESRMSHVYENQLGSNVNVNIFTSNPELTSMSMLDIKAEMEDDQEPAKQKNCASYMKQILNLLDFSLFKKPLFQLMSALSMFGVLNAMVNAYLPAMAMERGVSRTDAALLLTITGILDFFSRLTVGYIADLKRVTVFTIMAIGTFIAGTVTHFIWFYNSYPLLVFFSVLNGIFGSVYMCLVPVCIVELMGVENMPKVLGFVAVFNGLSISASHPIIGAIRDGTGSYALGFNFIGVCTYITTTLLVVTNVVKKRIDAKQNLPVSALPEKEPLK